MVDVASPYNRLLPAEDIMRLQILRNADLEKAHRESRLRNLTLRKAVQEASDALRWLLEDFMHGGESMIRVMRGLGILCIFIAVVLLAVDALIE